MLDVGLLSKRELECLALLASGLRYQRIAFQLGTSVRTVEKQICSARMAEFERKLLKTYAKKWTKMNYPRSAILVAANINF